jgi:hypothetical protein
VGRLLYPTRGRVLVLLLAEGTRQLLLPQGKETADGEGEGGYHRGGAAKLRPKVGWVSLRETLCSEGFDDKRGWRRMAALLGAINAPFCR